LEKRSFPLFATSSLLCKERFIHNVAALLCGGSSIVPVINYGNADIQKLQIVKENKGKSGVYK
jgi:hypothetical protein